MNNAVLFGDVLYTPDLIVNAPKTKRPTVAGTIFALTDIVRVLVANPKKSGSAARERFALYVDGLTVAQTLAISGGPNRADFLYDVRHGFVTVGPETVTSVAA